MPKRLQLTDAERKTARQRGGKPCPVCSNPTAKNQGYCLECVRTKRKARHYRRPEGICAKCGAPRRKNTAYCEPCFNERQKVWRKTHPMTEEQRIKNNVRGITRNRVNAGVIARQSCKKCGDPKTQIHHLDYSDPMKIEWLCKPCHMEHHYGS